MKFRKDRKQLSHFRILKNIRVDIFSLAAALCFSLRRHFHSQMSNLSWLRWRYKKIKKKKRKENDSRGEHKRRTGDGQARACASLTPSCFGS